jgi:hypothetical protein
VPAAGRQAPGPLLLTRVGGGARRTSRRAPRTPGRWISPSD